MHLATFYVTFISYVGLFSACALTMISSYAAWYKYATQNKWTRLKHIIVDGIMSLIVGAFCPVFTMYAVYSFLYDRDSFMERIYS